MALDKSLDNPNKTLGADGGNASGSNGSDSVVDSAKEAASQMLDQVRDQATMRADAQRQTVASGFVSVGDAFHRMSDGLREHDQGPVAQYAAELGHALGDRVQNAAQYLRDRDVRQLLHDTEDFARRSPGLFLGGAFLLGLGASRFLRSSRPAPGVALEGPDPSRALPPASNRQMGQSYPRSSSAPSTWTRISTAEPGLGNTPDYAGAGATSDPRKTL